MCYADSYLSTTGFCSKLITLLLNATKFGLISKDDQGQYSTVRADVEKGLSQEGLSLIFRKYLQQYKPFELLCEYILLGDNPGDCLRKTRTILNLPDRAEVNLGPLLRWGIDVGISSKTNGKIKLKSEIARRVLPVSGLIETDLTDEMSPRLYLQTRLTPSAYAFLDDVDKTPLTKALMVHSANLDDSAENAGQALEDFLRDIGAIKAVDTSGCNGALQVAAKLRSECHLHPKFINLVGGISTVRDASTHIIKDKITGKPWAKTPESAFQIILLTLTAIRAIYLWIFEGRQEI
ncbi:MAG: hypothetical protein ACFFCW_43410 [Candidatus Hodarchaeota archaeon]